MRVVWTSIALCAVLLLIGCVFVPVPASRRVEGPKGKLEKVDTSFIQPGTTRRAEIEEKLTSINLGMKNPELFLGRFKSSSSAIGGAMLGPPIVTPFGGRLWKTNNLLITFDKAGTVKQVQNISDDHLDKELLLWLSDHEQPITYPLRVRGSIYHDQLKGEGYLVLEENRIRFVEVEQFRNIWRNSKLEDAPITDPNLIEYKLELGQWKHFFGETSDKGEISRKLLFKRDASKRADRTVVIHLTPTPDELLSIVAYAKKQCPAVKLAGPKW